MIIYCESVTVLNAVHVFYSLNPQWYQVDTIKLIMITIIKLTSLITSINYYFY